MTQFNNQAFSTLVSDLIHDAFYVEGRSNRGKTATIRQYTEVIIRRILDYTHEEYVTLGKADIVDSLKLASDSNSLLMDSIENIREIGNDCTHSQVIAEISKEDFEMAITSLINVYSYLFVAYFKQNKFGSNLSVQAAFSILPPIIRYIALNQLYEQDPDNLAVIDKLSLAILKSHDYEEALAWLHQRKDQLIKISAVSKEAVRNCDERLAKSLIADAPNMYKVCFDRISQVSEVIDEDGLVYNDFESAMPLYEKKLPLEGDAPEIVEFNSLMEFVYLGRKSIQNPKLENIDKYLAVG